MRKVVVLGASPNEQRYSNQAVIRFKQKGYKVLPIGIKNGVIDGVDIITDLNQIENESVDLISLYISPKNQEEWIDVIINLRPQKVIFNPETENQELVQKLKAKGIESEYACSLVLLSTGLL